MKLSIIVPVYKVRNHLQNCIESILQQTYTDYELILVDDGSPDACGSICDRYAQECEKIRVIHKKNGGLSSARNAGLAIAQGEYITFVDGDDTVASSTYDHNMRILLANPDIDILEYPIIEHYGSDKQSIVSFEPQKIYGCENIFRDWASRQFYKHCYACNKIYRSDLFFFVRYPEGEVFEDILTTPMLIESCNCIYYSDCGFYYYHEHEGTISTTHSFASHKFRYRNFVNLYKKVKEQYKMELESVDILFEAVNCLTTLLRCSDGTKEERKKACDTLKNERIPINELYKMELPLRTKIKFTPLALFGAPFHSKLLALFHKKL